MEDGLTPYQLGQIRDALGQAGSDQGAMLAGGLRLGAFDPQALAGDLAMEGSIKRSTALSAGVRRSTAQPILTATWTSVSFDTVEWDQDALFDLNVPTRLTARTGGIYGMYAYVQIDASALGVRYLRLFCNNAVIITQIQYPPNASLFIAGIWKLNEGDYVEFRVYQDSGGTLNLVSGLPGFGPTFALARIA